MIEKANEILEEAKMNMEDAVVFLEEDLKTYRGRQEQNAHSREM